MGADGQGRLFMSSDHLIRAIRKAVADDVRQFLGHEETRLLIQEGNLISAEIEVGGAEEYPLLLRHEILPRQTSPAEWSMEMLREAALFALRMAERLASYGYLFLDPHPFNIGFVNTRPVLLDYGCVVKATAAPPTMKQGEMTFLESFVEPLRLMAQGYEPVARAMLLKGVRFRHPNTLPLTVRALIQRRLFRALSGKAPLVALAHLRRRVRRSLSVGSPSSTTIPIWISKMRRIVLNLPQGTQHSRWTSYHPDAALEGDPGSEALFAKKLHCVEGILAPIQFESITDLGCNRGLFARHFARQGKPVVAIDSDEWCINDLFRRAYEEQLPISTAVMSVTSPTPTPPLKHGEEVSVSKRLGSDLVLALALIHHLVALKRCDFETFIQILLVFTRRYALVEFVSALDPTIVNWRNRAPEWYTCEDFEKALTPFFRILDRQPSVVSTRTLYVLERIAADR